MDLEANCSSSPEPEESVGEARSVETVSCNAAAAKIANSSGSPPNPNPSPPKGYGLRKWRRIRRESNKEFPVTADTTVPADAAAAPIHKRRISPAEARGESNPKGGGAEVAEDEGSVASNIAVVNFELVAGGAFSVGADSDNSEDRSSTAASAPRMRHEGAVIGRERAKGKGSSARGQRGRGRGDHVRSERKHSRRSSAEPELRSSDAALVRGSGDGKESEVSVNDEGLRTFEEVGLGYQKENGVVGDSLIGDLDEDSREGSSAKRENDRLSADLDPFMESIAFLQTAQEALETEIQKFEKIGKEPIFDGSSGSSPGVEAHFLELKQKVSHLEHELQEATATAIAKDSKVFGLEAIFNQTNFQKKEIQTSNLPPGQGNHMETVLELELEGLLKKSIEAEIECLIIAGATRSCQILLKDQPALLEQNTLLEGQAQVMLKLRNAENKVARLKAEAEELEDRCKELLGINELLMLQNKVCGSSLSCFIQLVMLSFAMWWFLMQLLPLSDGVVPT